MFRITQKILDNMTRLWIVLCQEKYETLKDYIKMRSERNQSGKNHKDGNFGWVLRMNEWWRGKLEVGKRIRSRYWGGEDEKTDLVIHVGEYIQRKFRGGKSLEEFNEEGLWKPSSYHPARCLVFYKKFSFNSVIMN